MPSSSTARKVATYVALLAYLFLAVGSIDGLVACFAPGDHVALEGRHDATYPTAPQSQSGVAGPLALQSGQKAFPAGDQEISSRHPSDCVDLPLEIHAAGKDFTGTVTNAPPRPAPEPAFRDNVVYQAPARAVESFPSGQKPTVDHTLRSLRTVILLI